MVDGGWWKVERILERAWGVARERGFRELGLKMV